MRIVGPVQLLRPLESWDVTSLETYRRCCTEAPTTCSNVTLTVTPCSSRGCGTERGGTTTSPFFFPVVHPEAHPPDACSPGNRPTRIHLRGKRLGACTVEQHDLATDSNHRGSVLRPGSVFRVYGHHQAHPEAEQRRVQWNGEWAARVRGGLRPLFCAGCRHGERVWGSADVRWCWRKCGEVMLFSSGQQSDAFFSQWRFLLPWPVLLPVKTPSAHQAKSVFIR